MFPADMNMRAIYPALQLCPESFQGIHARARFGTGVLTAIVVYLEVAVARLVNVFVAAHFVRADRCAGQNLAQDQSVHRGLVAAGHDLSDQLAAALQHPDNNRLIPHISVALAADRAADNCFVDFNEGTGTAKRIVAVKQAHIFADLVTHAPCRLVGHTNLALDFLSCNAVPRRAELKHDKEPVAKACAGPVEWRPGCRIDLMPAILANISPSGRHPIIMRAFSAACAIVTFAVAGAHKVVEAAFLCRKAVLKLAERGGFRFHTHYVAQSTKCRKGIIADQVRGDDY